MNGKPSRRNRLLVIDRKSGSAGMPRPRSTLFPYTTLFRSTLVIIMVANKYAFLQITRRRFLNEWEAFKKEPPSGDRSEERFSRNAETEIYTLSLHDALPIYTGHNHGGE